MVEGSRLGSLAQNPVRAAWNKCRQARRGWTGAAATANSASFRGIHKFHYAKVDIG